MSPLRERKRDIPVIARSLLPNLNAKHHRTVRRLSHSALNRLVDHDWPLNGTELYQVLSRAVLICDGDELLADHISLHSHQFEGGRFNLLDLPALGELARRQNVPRILRWSTVPLFLLVLSCTLFGPVFDNAANLAVWTLWWPALLLTGFFLARGWCSYCPMEAVGELAGARRRLLREPSIWVKRWGPDLSLSLFVGILLVEQATGMFSWPFATGLLLLALLVSTVAGDLYLGRRGWCKYLCPLGRIVSLVSRISIIEMHSNHNVCVSRCRVDECVKEKGCPMGLHPTAIDNADHCVLCLDCVRNCPHNSMQLDLRNPLSGLLNPSRRGFSEAVFTVALVGLIISVRMTPYIYSGKTDIFSHTLWSSMEFLTALLISAAFTLMAMLFSIGMRRHRWKASFAICGSAYLPLALTGLFLLYFRTFVEGGEDLVPLTLAGMQLDRWVDAKRFAPDLGTLRLLIPPIIIAGGAFSWFSLGSMKRQYNLHDLSYFGHRLLVIMSTCAFVFLL